MFRAYKSGCTYCNGYTMTTVLCVLNHIYHPVSTVLQGLCCEHYTGVLYWGQFDIYCTISAAHYLLGDECKDQCVLSVPKEYWAVHSTLELRTSIQHVVRGSHKPLSGKRGLFSNHSESSGKTVQQPRQLDNLHRPQRKGMPYPTLFQPF